MADNFFWKAIFRAKMTKDIFTKWFFDRKQQKKIFRGNFSSWNEKKIFWVISDQKNLWKSENSGQFFEQNDKKSNSGSFQKFGKLIFAISLIFDKWKIFSSVLYAKISKCSSKFSPFYNIEISIFGNFTKKCSK